MRFEMAGQFDDRLLREFILLIGGRDRFRRSDYRALEVRRAVPAAAGDGSLLGVVPST